MDNYANLANRGKDDHKTIWMISNITAGLFFDSPRLVPSDHRVTPSSIHGVTHWNLIHV